MTTPQNAPSALVWDLPTRVFHWLLVAAFGGAWLTFDDNRYLYVHVYVGYVFLGLLVFRFLWGVVGTHYARFHAFAYAWPSVRAYSRALLTGQAHRHIGHNPAGGWAIFLMLALGLIVAVSGLLTLGGEETHGPLRGLIPYGVGELAKDAHEISAWTMLLVVLVHLGGVVVESVLHRENLVAAMLTGHKPNAPGAVGVEHHGVLGTLMLLLVLASAWYWFRGYVQETADQPYVPFLGTELPDNAMWRTECGDCHVAFHPTLLPARSWERLMAQQHEHFGDDLSLDDATVDEIKTFLLANAAEAGLSEAGRKINASVTADVVPLRITETQYWQNKHHEIGDKYWKNPKVKSKANCAVCHLDAARGTFEDSAMRLPKLDAGS